MADARRLLAVRHQEQRGPVLLAQLARELQHVRAVAESRLPVGSSASSSGGRCAIARAIATRCISPPESCAGKAPARVRQPHPRQQLAHPLRPPRRRLAEQLQRQLHILRRGQRREQMEELEDIPAMPPLELRELRRRARGSPPRPTRPRPYPAGRSRPGNSAAWSCRCRKAPSARPAPRVPARAKCRAGSAWRHTPCTDCEQRGRGLQARAQCCGRARGWEANRP